MKRTTEFVFGFLLLLSITIQSCHKSNPEPTTGTLSGTITDVQTGTGLAQASIFVFNASDNSPVGVAIQSNGQGQYSTSLAPGSYYIKVYKQGYNQYPSTWISPISFTIAVAQVTTQSVILTSSPVANAGMISGNISSSSGPASGILVVAEDNANTMAFSTISDKNGNYTIFNVPSDSYKVKGYTAGFTSTYPSATVSANTTTTGIDVLLTSSSGATISCSITNLAVSNGDVDIELVHPITMETIPGLSGVSVNQLYSFAKVPDGTFLARASYQNDQRVMDPDRVVKFGQPQVVVSGGVATISANGTTSNNLTFYVTGSVSLVSPTNDLSTTTPFDVTGTTPTFQWASYASTNDYVIEVTEVATGNIIWGGFNKSVSPTTKNITIPSSQTSIQYNSDGKASSSLISGKAYRWKIYASKNDNTSSTGWKLISASEDQLGLVKIK